MLKLPEIKEMYNEIKTMRCHFLSIILLKCKMSNNQMLLTLWEKGGFLLLIEEQVDSIILYTIYYNCDFTTIPL